MNRVNCARLSDVVLVSAVLCFLVSPAVAAPISYATPTSLYTQNFDMLPNAPENVSLQGTPQQWADDVSVTDWQIWHSGYSSGEGGVDGHHRLRIGPGTATTGSVWSFGSSGSTDRALGSVGSTVIGEARWGTRFLNSTGVTLGEFTVTYVGEQWRDGGAGVAQTANFEYSLDPTATDIGHVGVAVDVPELAFTSPKYATAGALNGNAAENQALISFTVTGIVWEPDTLLWIRWRDLDHASADHGLAVDDLVFSADVPEPATLTLLAASLILVTRRRR